MKHHITLEGAVVCLGSAASRPRRLPRGKLQCKSVSVSLSFRYGHVKLLFHKACNFISPYVMLKSAYIIQSTEVNLLT